MGRRLNHATPTVINTELIPFDESFYIIPDGQLEQWYYDNTTQYAPNRKITPLTLTPKLSVLAIIGSNYLSSLIPDFQKAFPDVQPVS